ncbi:hypothetical protein ACFLZG_06210 [Thermodesulfobacteriota bacterium]
MNNKKGSRHIPQVFFLLIIFLTVTLPIRSVPTFIALLIGAMLLSFKEPDLNGNDKTRTMIIQRLGAVSQYEKELIAMRMKSGRMHNRRAQI